MSEANSEAEDAGMPQFRDEVREWINLPEQIKTAEEPIKLLKARYKELEVSILQYMHKQGIEQCAIPDTFGGGVVVPKSSMSKSSVKTENRKVAFEALARKRGIEVTYADYEAELEATRDLKSKSVLKRAKRGKK